MSKDDNKNEGKNLGIGSEIAREGYEASVVHRMTGRAGAKPPKGSPGIALEIMATDKRNMKDLLKPDTVTKLTKSSTATQVDAVTTKSGKVIERIQYKDTVSPSGVRKTVNQVKSGKYQQAQLWGTKEAAKQYNDMAKAEGISKRMHSTGISHNSTQRVGDKFTKQPIKAASLGDAVKNSTAIAVGITAATEVVKSVANGDSVGECTANVVSKGVESAVTASAAAVVGEVAGSIAAVTSAPAVVPAAIGIGAATIAAKVVGEVTDGAFDEIGENIGLAVDNIGYTVEDAVDNIGYTVEDAVDNIGNTVEDVTDNVRYAVENVTDNITDVAESIGDTIGDIAVDVGDTISDVVDDIGDGISSAAESVTDFFSDIFSIF